MNAIKMQRRMAARGVQVGNLLVSEALINNAVRIVKVAKLAALIGGGVLAGGLLAGGLVAVTENVAGGLALMLGSVLAGTVSTKVYTRLSGLVGRRG
jgi:hypothetical protein